MKKDTSQETTELTLIEPQDLDKPRKDTNFAHESAKMLMDIVKKNNWAKKLGGQSDHLQYEAWQTVGKYYGYSVKTYEAEYVEFGNTWGFKAKATVVNENTGIEVGGAEAYCMNDEKNWANKPKFQLASMAQTRAGSKALRQNLGFVVALAGYNPTPAEEMDGVHDVRPVQGEITHENNGYNGRITEKQEFILKKLLAEKGYTEHELCVKYDVTKIQDLTKDQASMIIGNLMKLEVKKKTSEEDIKLDLDEIDKGIAQMN